MKQLALPLALTLLLVTGCTANKSVLGHRVAFDSSIKQDLTPEVVTKRESDGTVSTVRTFAVLRENYESATSDEKRKHYRNLIIRRLMLLDDEYFLAWSQKLYGGRTVARTTSDIALGLLTAGAAAANPAKMAETLSLMASGIATTQVAFEKNLFLEQSAGALIAKMEQDRARVDSQITQYLRNNSDTDYPLEQGLRDFLRYYKSGTLANAADGLKADTTAARDVAQAQVEGAKGDTVVAPFILARASVPPPKITVQTSQEGARGSIKIKKLDDTVRQKKRTLATWVFEANESQVTQFLVAVLGQVEAAKVAKVDLKDEARVLINQVETDREADVLLAKIPPGVSDQKAEEKPPDDAPKITPPTQPDGNSTPLNTNPTKPAIAPGLTAPVSAGGASALPLIPQTPAPKAIPKKK